MEYSCNPCDPLSALIAYEGYGIFLNRSSLNPLSFTEQIQHFDEFSPSYAEAVFFLQLVDINLNIQN